MQRQLNLLKMVLIFMVYLRKNKIILTILNEIEQYNVQAALKNQILQKKIIDMKS